jgi:sodium transport system ATP-binding protein
MIKVENLYKSFKLSKKQKKEYNATADEAIPVNKISFTCEPGKIFSLLGPNGAGKTTTLRMISTIIKPTSGSIEVNGFDTVKQSKEVRQSIGFLTGSTGLYERLTADEVLKYYADLNDVTPADFELRKKHYYDLLDMHDFAGKRIGQLSTGMKQKVSITRTMIHDPAVVVFDEPTSGLDVITAENIIKLIRDCKTQGKTVIFSSHIMSEVDLLCDDLAIIDRGKLLFNDTMANFRANMQADSLTGEFIRIVNANKVINA